MADPISTTSALVGFVVFSFQASKALRDTIKSFTQHPKYVRDLWNELGALEDVLQLLQQSLVASDDAEYATLELPVQRCGHACEEFRQTLEKCFKQDHSDGSSFRGWLRIRWMGSDIHGFKDTLAGYKSTIAIAMAGVNLRTAKASLNVIQEYKELIQSTTIDLKDHLYNIDNKLRESTQDRPITEESLDRTAMLAERASTLECLEICAQVSNYIGERQKHMVGNVEDHTAPTAQAEGGAESLSARQIMNDSLHGCRLNIKSANAQLSNRLQCLSTTLSDTSADFLLPTSSGTEDRYKMTKEIESVRQCLDICLKATEQADKARTNVMEDISTAEDSRQILVSTIGDLIAAHKITAGARSLQAIGQMSDETLQHLSRTHISTITKSTPASDDPYQRPESHMGLGRTLGSGNVRTL